MAVAAVLAGGGTAWAQEAPQQPASKDDGQLQQVVVTGSRIARSTFTTPNPVTVLDSQEISNLGLVNVGDVLAELPQNSNFFSANNVGLGNFNVGAQLANLRGLNSFFGTRTLTLVDTQRVVPQATGGGVDVTLIPSMLVASTEVVTGGASAIYGSDAVAGVVNIILDHKLNGLKLQADYGQTSHHDGGTSHLSGAYGTDLGSRVHVIVGGEYENSEDIGLCSQARSWCRSGQAMFTNNQYTTNGQPHYIIGPNGTSANTSQTGVLTPCAVPAPVCMPGSEPQYIFNAAGTSAGVFDPGLYPDGAGAFGYSQGAGATGVGAYDGTTLRPAIKRYTGLGNVDFNINDKLSAYLEFNYARSEAINPVANGALGPSPLEVSPGVFVPFTASAIAPDNAYLPPQFQPGGANALPAGGALLGFNMNGIAPARNATNNNVVRVTGGFKGEIAGSWGWDAYFEWGQNQNSENLYNSAVSSLLGYALNAVVDPATNQIVCAATLPGPQYDPAAAGCQPLDLFGSHNASAAALAYAFRDLQEYSTQREEVISANVHGDLFKGFGAGPVKASFGAEARRNTADVTHDLQNQPWYNSYVISYGLDYAGLINVREANAELNVPVLKGLRFAKYLEFDGAIRETDNKNQNRTVGADTYGDEVTHNIPSWKLSGLWDVTDWLRFRATRSLDVRAAGFRELYESYAVTAGGPFGSIVNPVNGQTQVVTALTGGNINLEPEKADTTTVGIVLTPTWGPLQGLQFSADWYDIILHDPITGPPFGLGVQNIVNLCYQEHADCDRIVFGTPGDFSSITQINNTAVNLGSYETRGIDFEASYRLPLASLSDRLPGDLRFRLLTSLLYNMTIDTGLPGALPVDYAGQSGPTAAFGGFNTSPRWQSNFFVTYSTGPLTATAQVRWIGPGSYEVLSAYGGVAVAPGDPGYATTNPNSINNNSVASATYINLSATYDVTDHVSLFATIDNLLNRDPPVAPGGNGYPTNPVYFDTLGMTWKFGIRAKF